MKNLSFVLIGIIIILSFLLYYRTGYFESSLRTQKMTFHLKNGDSIMSKKYYRDLSGNWILLDKSRVIPKNSWKQIDINVK